jgi:hypothetical protein
MMHPAALTARVLLTGSLAGLAACSGGQAGSEKPQAKPVYLGANAEALKDDLVQVTLKMKGVSGPEQIDDYAACVASAYAVKNKAGFVRHVRTISDKEGGIWRADAVYSVTSVLPEGLQTIDAEVTLADCEDRGIPTDENAGE